MGDTVIRVERLGKKYQLHHEQWNHYITLRDAVMNRAKSFGRRLMVNPQPRSCNPYKEDFWALKDVSFEIQQGERVGIIGRNGAGKTTLLKVLSRITEPTAGRISLRGRVSSLLEVGTGFHPELTGRENIFLNGAILGMSRAEIKKKFDEIVDFAQIEKFLDTPVKRYSSGMYMRLAFAVAAHLEPEILLVDEVLAVGDAEFQKKCLGKMEDVSTKEGRTVLFVSHNMAAVEKLCMEALLLSNGTVTGFGKASNIVQLYLSGEFVNGYHDLTPKRTVDDSKRAFFLRWYLKHEFEETNERSSGLDLNINLEVCFRESVKYAFFGVALWSEDGILVWAANSHGGVTTSNFSEGKYIVKFQVLKVHLRPGTYWVEASINSEDGQLDRWEAQPYLKIIASKPNHLPPAWQGLMEFDYVCSVERWDYSSESCD